MGTKSGRAAVHPESFRHPVSSRVAAGATAQFPCKNLTPTPCILAHGSTLAPGVARVPHCPDEGVTYFLWAHEVKTWGFCWNSWGRSPHLPLGFCFGDRSLVLLAAIFHHVESSWLREKWPQRKAGLGAGQSKKLNPNDIISDSGSRQAWSEVTLKLFEFMNQQILSPSSSPSLSSPSPALPLPLLLFSFFFSFFPLPYYSASPSFSSSSIFFSVSASLSLTLSAGYVFSLADGRVLINTNFWKVSQLCHFHSYTSPSP